MTFSPTDYLDLNHTEHRMLFENSGHVWDALKQITSYLQFRLKPVRIFFDAFFVFLIWTNVRHNR